MPIWLRRFTFETIKEYYDKQTEETAKIQNTIENKSNKAPSRPNITPTYTTKALKK
jgi:hypothetical protein